MLSGALPFGAVFIEVFFVYLVSGNSFIDCAVFICPSLLQSRFNKYNQMNKFLMWFC